jgi:hypothetical protein
MNITDKTDIELIEIIEEDFIETFQNSAFDELIMRSSKQKIEQIAKKYHTLKIRETLHKLGVINFDDLEIPKSKILSHKDLIVIFENEFKSHVIRRKDFYEDRRIY